MPRWTNSHKPIVIKKYGNRRLYDTEASQYITQEELAEKIKGGADIRVVDAKTNEDLTQVTLTQIILESRGAAHLLPVPLLMQLVRMDDHALAEFFGRYVSWAMEIYMRAKQSAEALAPFNPFATAPFSAMNTIARWFGNDAPPPSYGGPPPSYGAPPPPPPYAAAVPPPSPIPMNGDGDRATEEVDAGEEGEVAGLRREIEQLKKKMKRARR